MQVVNVYKRTFLLDLRCSPELWGGGGTQKQKISNMEVTSKPVNHFSGLNHALANPEWLPHLSQPQV